MTNWSLAFEEQADLSLWADVLDRIDSVYAKYLGHTTLKKELLLVPLSDSEKNKETSTAQHEVRQDSQLFLFNDALAGGCRLQARRGGRLAHELCPFHCATFAECKSERVRVSISVRIQGGKILIENE